MPKRADIEDGLDTLIPAAEAAKLVRRSAETIRRWVRNGRLKATSVNGYGMNIRRRDVLALVGPYKPRKGRGTNAAS